MGSDVYPRDYVRPSAEDREEINRIIFDELVYGVFKPEAVARFQQVIGRMKDDGCDAVVLGCTEIPLIMSDANSPLPTLDSTRLLARAALRRACEPCHPKPRRRRGTRACRVRRHVLSGTRLAPPSLARSG